MSRPLLSLCQYRLVFPSHYFILIRCRSLSTLTYQLFNCIFIRELFPHGTPFICPFPSATKLFPGILGLCFNSLLSCRLFLLAYGSLLLAAKGVNLGPGGVQGSHEGALEVKLTPQEVQEAVREAVVIVKEQIEVVEPHVFQSGESRRQRIGFLFSFIINFR